MQLADLQARSNIKGFADAASSHDAGQFIKCNSGCGLGEERGQGKIDASIDGNRSVQIKMAIMDVVV